MDADRSIDKLRDAQMHDAACERHRMRTATSNDLLQMIQHPIESYLLRFIKGWADAKSKKTRWRLGLRHVEIEVGTHIEG